MGNVYQKNNPQRKRLAITATVLLHAFARIKGIGGFVTGPTRRRGLGCSTRFPRNSSFQGRSTWGGARSYVAYVGLCCLAQVFNGFSACSSPFPVVGRFRGFRAWRPCGKLICLDTETELAQGFSVHKLRGAQAAQHITWLHGPEFVSSHGSEDGETDRMCAIKVRNPNYSECSREPCGMWSKGPTPELQCNRSAKNGHKRKTQQELNLRL